MICDYLIHFSFSMKYEIVKHYHYYKINNLLNNKNFTFYRK